MLLALVLLCSNFLMAELESSTSPSTMGVENNVTVASTNLTFTAATTATTSCDVNGTSCATVAKNNTTAPTAAKISTVAGHQNATSPIPTTPIPATVAPSVDLEAYKNFDPDMCTCDLHRGLCDINCCCDKDCSSEDKLVFRSCKREVNLIRDTSYCQYMDYIYINNTPYAWEVNQNGLFCIAKSNLPPKYTLQKKKPIATLEDAELQKQNKYSWTDMDQQMELLKFNMSESFIYGANVWTIADNVLGLFQLPTNFVTHICILKQNMRFLQNFKTKCSQVLGEDNASLSATTYFKDVFVIRAPRYFNESLFSGTAGECPKNVCLPIEAKFCDGGSGQCFNFSNKDHRLATSCNFSVIAKTTCTNVVEKVRYNFYHNGTRGFTKVELFVTLRNVSYHVGPSDFEIAQEFEVNYLWANHSLNYSTLLSGHPGYLIGKPVLVANMITHINATNSTASNETETAIHLHAERDPFDVTDNFLVFPATSKRGECVLNNRSYVASEFGYNMVVKCRVSAGFDLKNKNFTAVDCCRILQKKIFEYWPISSTNLTDINRLVGRFGNANASDLEDWMEVLADQSPAQILNKTSGNFTRRNATLLCDNLVTTLKIDVFHARVDFKELCNQEKIVGVSYRFGTPKSFHFTYDENKLVFEADIREALMFFDVTAERVQKFVDPPTFRISLPYDFYYPFIKVGNSANALHLYPFLVIVNCILSIS